ncbi:MAG: AzlC family ABC transporter permease [Anaerolineales bacterium]
MTSLTPDARPSPRGELFAGARDQLPFLLGVIPFGLLFGAAAIDAGIPPAAAQGLSLFVFAGGSQFITVGLVHQLAPAWVILATIAIVNLRHALYSASIAPHYARMSWRWKALLAWLLTDEAFATTIRRYRRPNLGTAHWYALGSGLTLWFAWQSSTAVGIAVGAQIPPTDAFGFVVPLSFLALLWPSLTDRPAAAAAILAAVLAVALADLPYRTGTLAASLAGITVGAVLEARRPTIARDSSGA